MLLLQSSWKANQSNISPHSSSRQRDMNKENVYVPTGQVTRARAKALGVLGGLPPLHPVVKQDQNHALQLKIKRASSDNILLSRLREFSRTSLTIPLTMNFKCHSIQLYLY